MGAAPPLPTPAPTGGIPRVPSHRMFVDGENVDDIKVSWEREKEGESVWDGQQDASARVRDELFLPGRPRLPAFGAVHSTPSSSRSVIELAIRVGWGWWRDRQGQAFAGTGPQKRLGAPPASLGPPGARRRPRDDRAPAGALPTSAPAHPPGWLLSGAKARPELAAAGLRGSSVCPVRGGTQGVGAFSLPAPGADALTVTAFGGAGVAGWPLLGSASPPRGDAPIQLFDGRVSRSRRLPKRGAGAGRAARAPQKKARARGGGGHLAVPSSPSPPPSRPAAPGPAVPPVQGGLTSWPLQPAPGACRTTNHPSAREECPAASGRQRPPAAARFPPLSTPGAS